MFDYDREYAEYWSNPERFGSHSFSDPQNLVRQILVACGPGKLLDVGSGMGLLVQTFLRAGVDARGVDVAEPVVMAGNERLPGRFHQGSVLSLPFPDGSFDTVISTDCLEHVAPEDIPQALGEMSRVSRRQLFLRISSAVDRDKRWHLTIRKRDWWEERLFEAGLRKHPNYYRINSYEALEEDRTPITLIMEKVPAAAVRRDSKQSESSTTRHDPALTEEHQGDMVEDASRLTGRQSDADLIRYQLAGDYVRPGDRVIALGCGSGAGLHILRHNSSGSRFIGIDPCPDAIAYATANFSDPRGVVEFRAADLARGLDALADHSVDIIAAFDVLESDADAPALLREICRVLIPGGRLIFSVSNHITRDRISAMLAGHLLPENLYQQHVDVAGSTDANLESAGRWLRPASWASVLNESGQWWIATAIRDPLDDGRSIAYRETVFGHLEAANHLSTQYARWYLNPWIVHSLVHVGYRVRSPALLATLATRLLKASPADSADYGAALCILAYQQLERPADSQSLAFFDHQIGEYLKIDSDNPHVLRWRISLTFVLTQLHLKCGFIDIAQRLFQTCSAMDPIPFSAHLATKTTDAFFWWGWLSVTQNDLEGARRAWTEGLAFGERLLKQPIGDVLIDPAFPNIFDHGDGMREFVICIENITRFANGLHLLGRLREGIAVEWPNVQMTFRERGDRLDHDLKQAQKAMAAVSAELPTLRHDLIDRTRQLDECRNDLIVRTAELDGSRHDLVQRTGELDDARRDLIERTRHLEASNQQLVGRTAELDQARKELIDRTAELDLSRAELIQRTADLDATRQELIGRTHEVDDARQQLAAAKKRGWFWRFRFVD